MRNFMDLSRALKGLADAFHTINLKLDGLYDSIGAVGNQFELIEEIVLAEDTAVIERTTEPDGTEYNFKHISITTETDNSYAEANNGTIRLNSNLLSSTLIYQYVRANTASVARTDMYNVFGHLVGIVLGGVSTWSSNAGVRDTVRFSSIDTIHKIEILLPTAIKGTIKIYAVRN